MMYKTSTNMLISFALISLIMTGCDSGGGGGSSSSNETFIQVTNAIPDSPSLTITVDVDVDDDDSTDESTSIQSFQQAIARKSKSVGDLVVSVSHGDDVILIDETTLSLQADTIHTLILTGSYSSPDYILVDRPIGDVDDDDSEQAEIQIVNLGSRGTLDIYLSSSAISTDDLPLTTLSSSGASGQFLLTGGEDYSLVVTEAGREDRLIEIESITFAERNRYTIIITDVLSTYETSISAYVVREGGATQTFQNVSQKPKLRFFNGVADGITMNIEYSDFFNSAVGDSISLGFREVSEYIEQDLSSVFLEVSGSDSGTPDAVAFNTVISMDSDTYYTLIIAGSVADGTVSTKLATTNESETATIVRAQFANAANITVLDDDGEEEQLTISFDVLQVGESLDESSPVASSMGFLSIKSVNLDPEPSLAVAEETDSGNIIAGPEPILLEGKSSQLIVVTEADGGGLPLNLSVHTRKR